MAKQVQDEQKERVLLRGEIVVAPNTSRERVVKVATPYGKKNRRRIAKHYKKMALLQDLAGESPTLGQVMGVIDKLWADESFEDELMPMLLGIENDKDAMRWYNGDGTPEYPGLDTMEIFRAFTEAAAIILTPEDSEVLRDVQKK